MDIYTNKNYICHDLSEVNFSNLQVTNYTNGDKIQYIHYDKIIQIALDLEKWVDVPRENCNKNKDLMEYDGYKHAKISISYQTKLYFKIKENFAIGYETYFISINISRKTLNHIPINISRKTLNYIPINISRKTLNYIPINISGKTLNHIPINISGKTLNHIPINISGKTLLSTTFNKGSA